MTSSSLTIGVKTSLLLESSFISSNCLQECCSYRCPSLSSPLLSLLSLLLSLLQGSIYVFMWAPLTFLITFLGSDKLQTLYIPLLTLFFISYGPLKCAVSFPPALFFLKKSFTTQPDKHHAGLVSMLPIIFLFLLLLSFLDVFFGHMKIS